MCKRNFYAAIAPDGAFGDILAFVIFDGAKRRNEWHTVHKREGVYKIRSHTVNCLLGLIPIVSEAEAEALLNH